MIRQHLAKVLLFSSFLLMSVGCSEFKLKSQFLNGNNNSNSVSGAANLVSYELINDIPEQTLKDYIEENDLPDILKDAIKIRRVDLYKVIYQTADAAGNTVNASGLLLVPKRKKKARLMSFHNWTLQYSQRNLAPSKGENVFINGMALIANLGFFVSIPDFVGFGNTENSDHYYMVSQLQAQVAHDMLTASKAVIEQLNKQIDDGDGIFLAGYSRGASVSMALHKYIESLPNPDFEIAVSSVGGGAYDLTDVFAKIFQQGSHPQPELISWALQSHIDAYSVNLTSADIYLSPYDAYDSQFYGGDLNLPESLTQIFKQEFMDGVINGTYVEMTDALDESYSINFETNAEIYMFHGKNDSYIPIESAYTARDTLRSFSNEVTFWEDDSDHEEGIPRFVAVTLLAYLKTVVEWSPLDTLTDIFLPENISLKTQSLDREYFLRKVDQIEDQLKN